MKKFKIADCRFGIELAAQRAAFVVDVDHSGIMVAQATRRNKGAIAAARAEVRMASAALLPYPDKRFDKGLAINSLRFWPEPVANLCEVARVLKAGGRILIVSQPRWAKTTAEVAQEGERIATQLAAAGFVEIQQLHESFQPIAAVAVSGMKVEAES